MDFRSHANNAHLPAPLDDELPQKFRAATSIASPTESTAEDDDSSSSSSSNSATSNDGDNSIPRKSSTETLSTTAGLFIQTDKPLPLNPQRTIPIPISRLWKRCGETSKVNESVAPDILRKTGSQTAQYSNHESGHDNSTQRLSPRRSKSLDNSDIGMAEHGRRGGRRPNATLIARFQSVDDADDDATNHDEEWHSEGQAHSSLQRGRGMHRTQSEIETDDYLNYSSMNTTDTRGPFAFLRGRR